MRTFKDFVTKKEQHLANEMMAGDAPPKVATQHGAATVEVRPNTDQRGGVLRRANQEEQEMYDSLTTPQERLEFIKYIQEKYGLTPAERVDMMKRLATIAKTGGLGLPTSTSTGPDSGNIPGLKSGYEKGFEAAKYFADKYGKEKP